MGRGSSLGIGVGGRTAFNGFSSDGAGTVMSSLALIGVHGLDELLKDCGELSVSALSSPESWTGFGLLREGISRRGSSDSACGLLGGIVWTPCASRPTGGVSESAMVLSFCVPLRRQHLITQGRNSCRRCTGYVLDSDKADRGPAHNTSCPKRKETNKTATTWGQPRRKEQNGV
jgi:hypothetical protein